jgi:hypothetical protein
VYCVRFRGRGIAARGALETVVFGLKTVFPPRREIGPRVGARTHTRRGEAPAEHSQRSGELCGRALVAQSNRRGGKLIRCFGRRPQPYFGIVRNVCATLICKTVWDSKSETTQILTLMTKTGCSHSGFIGVFDDPLCSYIAYAWSYLNSRHNTVTRGSTQHLASAEEFTYHPRHSTVVQQRSSGQFFFT